MAFVTTFVHLVRLKEEELNFVGDVRKFIELSSFLR